ncbi:hypothetical protein RS030_81427 [Cryptosporidium xiaoi]|uniref:U3 small nucleolar RNA-associated protein 20 domain-containing protein n=1 Tax=Cryptosporidium xiaoi TaxID=659607 RepID=A0AAV9XWM4_9CRYT
MNVKHKSKISAEEKTKREKGVKNNKFRFENYVEKLSGIEIKIGEDEIWTQNSVNDCVEEDKWYSESTIESFLHGSSELYEQEEKDTDNGEDEIIKSKLSRTAFGDSLRHWESEVRYLEFVELVKTLKPYRYSLVHIIDNLGYIIQVLTSKLNDCEHPETAEAISFLLGSLAKDTRLELIPFLPLIFQSLSDRLENQITDQSITGQGGVGLYNVKIIQSVFSCTGTIFFYLSNYILKDLLFYLNVYKKWIYHSNSTIRHFSAESIAYAIKRSRNKDLIKSLDHILLFVKEEKESLLGESSVKRSDNYSNFLFEWLFDIFSSIVFSINGCISNQGDVVCRYLLRHISFGLCIENKMDYLSLKSKNQQFSDFLSNKGLISDYLNSIDKSDLICNDTFTSICDSIFRESFTGLNKIIGDIFFNLRSVVVENFNSISFEMILFYLIEIYYELYLDLRKKITSIDKINTIELEKSVSSLVDVLNIISNWICMSSQEVDMNIKNMDSSAIHDSPKNYKKRSFNLEYAQITVVMLLVPIQETNNTDSIEFRLLSRYVLSLINITTNVAIESFHLKSLNFVESLVFLDYRKLFGDRFLNFGHLILNFIGSSLDDNKISWKWLTILLDMFLENNCYTVLINILNTISYIIPMFEYRYNEELDHFMKVVLKYQMMLLDIRTINKELCVQIMENILLFIKKTEEIGFCDNYYRNSGAKLNIMTLCIEYISSFHSPETCYDEVNIVLELLSAVFGCEINSSDSICNNILSDLKYNLLKLYNTIFGIKFTKEESNNGFNITDVYVNLSSIRTFKYFCQIFEILGMNEVVNLEFMLKNINEWINLSLLEKNRITISHIPNIPMEYNVELVYIIGILIRLSRINNSMVLESIKINNKDIDNKLKLLFLYWIFNPLQQVRKMSVNLFISYLGNLDDMEEGIKKDLALGLNLIKELESSDTNIENERSKVRIMQQICDLTFCIISKSQESCGEYSYVLRYLISSILSQLYVKLSLIWKPCVDMLVKLVKTVNDRYSISEKKSESFSIIDTICSSICHMIYSNSNNIRTPTYINNGEGIEFLFTDEFTILEWCCKLLTQIFVSIDKKSLLIKDSFFYHNLILYWTIQMSYDIEGMSESFYKLKKDKHLPLKNGEDDFFGECTISYCGKIYSFLDLDFLYSNKGQIQRINHLLVVLESILNLYTNYNQNTTFEYLFNKFSLECVPNLLKINHIEIQLRLVRIICQHSSDSSFLLKYKSMFEVLISGSSGEKEDEGSIKSFRNSLLMYPLSVDRDDIIRKEDRAKVIPIIIRILLSKLGKDKQGKNKSSTVVKLSKKGNKALTSNNKRKIIVSYFSELPKEEVSMLLSVIVEPMVRVVILDANGTLVNFNVLDLSKGGLLIENNNKKESVSENNIEVEGHLKNYLLDGLIKNDVVGNLQEHWFWIEEAIDSTCVDFGFLYENKELLFTLPISGKEIVDFQIRMVLKPFNMLNNEYKRIILFLNYVENLLDMMPHSLRENSHSILAILLNILQLNIITMKNVNNYEIKYTDGVEEELDGIDEEEPEEEIRVEDETKADDCGKDLLSKQNKLVLSRKEILSIKKRSKLVIRILFTLMTKIILNYPEYSNEWIYLLRPVSPYILNKFSENLRLGKENASLYLPSTINFILSISKNGSLFILYKKLFPTVIGDLSNFISDDTVLDNIKQGSLRNYECNYKGSEMIISRVVEMYLNIIFGGSENLSTFKEKIKKNPEVFQNSSKISLLQYDSGSEIIEITEKTDEFVLEVSRFGLSIINKNIPNIVNSLQKIIYKRSLVNTSKKMEIVTLNELILLKVFALLEIKKIHYSENTTNDNEGNYGINISKIVLLLILSCMNKLHLKNENTVNSNIGVFDLVLNLLKSSNFCFSYCNSRESVLRGSQYEKNLVERINILLEENKVVNIESNSGFCNDKGSLVNISKYRLDFYCLISDIMSSLLLKTENIKLRVIISEIYLHSELIILGTNKYDENNQFDLRNFATQIYRQNKVKSTELIVPIYIYNLNVPLINHDKRSLESRMDVDLQLEILNKLNTEILFKTVNLSENEEINLLNVNGESIYSTLCPLLNQLFYHLSNNSSSQDFSITNASIKIIKNIISCWCNEIRYIHVKNIINNDNIELKLFSIYKLILDLFIPFEEEILKYSRYSLSKKRAILSVIDTLILEFTPYVDYFSNRFNVSKEDLVKKFHLGLYPIREYYTIEDGEKVNLFEEIVHIQKHKRARALNFLGRFSKFCLNYHKNNVGYDFKFNKEVKDDFSVGNNDNCFLNIYELGYPLSSYTVKTIGINFCIHSLIQKDSNKETYHLGLGDNSLRSMESFSLYLDWKECIDLTGYLIRLLRLYPQRKSYIIKAICSLLNSFDFQINNMVVMSTFEQNNKCLDECLDFKYEGNNVSGDFGDKYDENENFDGGQNKSENSKLEERLSDMQANVKQRLLPLLKSVMVDRSYKAKELTVEEYNSFDKKSALSQNNYGLIRSDIVLVIIRVLRCMPSREFHSELPRLITQLILALKSKDRDIRRSSRSSLKSICKTLGVNYLVWIFKQMSNILTKGYQLPVLIFTVHSILSEIFSVTNLIETMNNKQNTVILDGCIEIISKMIIEELNRIADPDRRTVTLDTIDTPITGTVDEGKYIKSPYIMRILSKNVTLNGINKLYDFLNDLLSGVQGERDESSIMSDSYSQKYLYWLKNLYLQFCIGLLNNSNISDREKLDFSLLNLAKNIVVDRNMIRDDDIKRLIVYSMNSQVTSLFQDPLNLLQGVNTEGQFNTNTIEDNKKAINKKDKYYSIQPGASTGRGTHQVIKHQRGFEKKVKSVVLCNSSLYLLNNILKLVNNGNFDLIFGNDGVGSSFNGNNSDTSSEKWDLCILKKHELVRYNMIHLIVLTFSDNSSELASISCKCLVRILLLNSMENSKKYEYLKIDNFGPLISKISLNIMQKSGISSNTSANNNITELISSSMKLFVALLIRPKSIEWFNSLFYDKSLNKITPYYANILKQLHITINDNRLRITSLQLLRQIVLYGKDQIKLSSESLGSLYSLIDYVLPIIVQYSASEPRIVSIGCNLYIEFLLYYPMSERSQKQRISILLENLPEYPTSEGRKTLLIAIHTLISRFPLKLMKESYNIMFLCGITLSLSVETEIGPINEIRGIVKDILDMYKNENNERIKLINTIFKTLNKVDMNNTHILDIKCGLIVLLRYIFEYYVGKKDVICLKKEIDCIGNIFFSEINGILDILVLSLNRDTIKDNLVSDGNESNIRIISLQRLEYETFNLLNMIVSDTDLFEILNYEWLNSNNDLKDGIGRTDLWRRFWNILILNDLGFGIYSNHLWNKSASLRLITGTLKQSLMVILKQKNTKQLTSSDIRAKSRLNSGFIVDYILSEDIFTNIFEKTVKLQFIPLLEVSPWLIPRVTACIQHLILLSSYINKNWQVPKKLSHLDLAKRSDFGINEDLKSNDIISDKMFKFSFYDNEKKRSNSKTAGDYSIGNRKRIKILEENQVKESDWIIYEEESENEIKDNSDIDDNELENLEKNTKMMLKKQKNILIDKNDNTEEVIDSYLLDQISEDKDCGEFKDDNEEVIKQCSGLEGKYILKEENEISLIRLDVYLWFLDRVSCCCRYYTTKPGIYRARLLLSIKTLNDMIELIPHLKDIIKEDDLFKPIKHSVKALYQCSTMLNRADIYDNSNDNLAINIHNFEWVNTIINLDSYNVIKQACIFAQKAIEKWDRVFSEINHSSMFMRFLSESRREVMQSRLERKSKLKLEKIRNTELAVKRKQSQRLRNKKNRIKKLGIKIRNRKLGLK